MSDKHSPLWIHPLDDGSYYIMGGDPTNDNTWMIFAETDDKRHAELIVKCVNSHAKLVEALKGAKDLLCLIHKTQKLKPNQEQSINNTVFEIRQALAEVEVK